MEHELIRLSENIDWPKIEKALEGDYRKEPLMVLKQELESYEFYLKQISECDSVIEECYKKFNKRSDGDLANDKKQYQSKNSPKFD